MVAAASGTTIAPINLRRARILPRTTAGATGRINLLRVLTLHRAAVTQRLVTPRLRARTPHRAALTRHPAAATAGEAAAAVAVVEAAEVRMVVEAAEARMVVEAVLTAVAVVPRTEAALTGTKSCS
jgi:hypothetical protein